MGAPPTEQPLALNHASPAPFLTCVSTHNYARTEKQGLEAVSYILLLS